MSALPAHEADELDETLPSTPATPRRILSSPHRLPERVELVPSVEQTIAAQVLRIGGLLDAIQARMTSEKAETDKRLDHLETFLPRRGAERWILTGILVGVTVVAIVLAFMAHQQHEQQRILLRLLTRQ